MKYFISCNNPVKVQTKKGLALVPCGHCVQCKQHKADYLTLLLDLEAQHNKYTEFLTLTYDDTHCPYVDTSRDFGHGDYLIVLPNRFVRKYNRHSQSYYYVSDKDALRFRTTTFDTLQTAPLLNEYYSRLDKYFARFPLRHSIAQTHDKMPILWYDDLHKYIKRLKKWFYEQYSETFRYYAICEYGSNSLRPHYHILLFHNSLKCRTDFMSTVKLVGHSKENSRECCTKLYLSACWAFGDTTTKTTDGRMGSYLAGYVNQHSVFPLALAKFPQRAFHSILLGAPSKVSVRTLFKERRFRELSETVVVDKSGVSKSISVPSSVYGQFSVRFTGHGYLDCESTFTLFRSTAKYARLFFPKQGDIFRDDEVYRFMIWFRDNGVRFRYDYMYNPLSWYIDEIAAPSYHNDNSINSLKSLLYATFKHYSLANILGLDSWSTLLTQFDLVSYLDYQNLKKHFELLESDHIYAYEYYSSIDPFSGSLDWNIVRTRSLFQKQQADASIKYTSNIKHRLVIDSYIN